MGEHPKLAKEFTFNIGITDDERTAKYNELWKDQPGFKPFTTTEDELRLFIDKCVETLFEVAEQGGNYVDDSVDIEVKMTYAPEDK